MTHIPFPPAPGGSVFKDEFPAPPISPGPDNGVSKIAFARWEKRSAWRRAYREKNGDRLRESVRNSEARKRAERSHHCCLLKLPHPLTGKLPAVAADKPHQ